MRFSLFTFLVLFSYSGFCATGSGHVQTELTAPLSIETVKDINYGTIAIDPAVGSYALRLEGNGSVTCPSSYVCTGTTSRGEYNITGAPSTPVSISMTGSTATLSDGVGNTLVFDPSFYTGGDSLTGFSLGGSGTLFFAVEGKLYLTGNEVAGTYSSQNAGGSGYTITVNY